MENHLGICVHTEQIMINVNVACLPVAQGERLLENAWDDINDRYIEMRQRVNMGSEMKF